MDGFFVFLSKKKSRNAANNANALWSAKLVDEIEGWLETHAETQDEALALQRAQYQDKLESNQLVPKLFKSTDGPMASGQITRFISV